jgi:hypothetical protein
VRRAIGRRPRLALLLAASASIAGISALDAEVGTTSTPTPATSPPGAIVAGSAADSSAWYCAGAAAAPSGSQAALLLTNPGAQGVSGMVQTVAAAGSSGSSQTTFTVPPDQQLTLPVSVGASTVSLQGGGVGVTEVVNGPLGWSLGPCASSTSDSWYFAHGSTASGDGMQVVLYNPTPTPAVADVSFVSASASLIVPPAYQGIPVAPGTVVVENVSDHVPNDLSLATEVTALSGALVAAELEETGAVGNGGMSVVEGANAPRSQWAFAENADTSGGGNVYTILNPGSRTVSVTVSIDLAQGQAAPLVVRVPPQSTAALTAQNETRIPAGTVFGLTFSAAGSGVVVARNSSVPGTPLPTTALTPAEAGMSRWLIPPVPPGQAPGALAVVDLAGHPVEVRIVGLGLPGHSALAPGSAPFTLKPGGVLVVSPSPAEPVGLSPVEVEANGPVAVELGVAPATSPGTGEVPAWPLAGPTA